MKLQTCPNCAQSFTPTHRGPIKTAHCCSLSCAAIYRHRRDPAGSARRVAIMRRGQMLQRRAREQELLDGCRTMVEAFRAGQKLERKRWEAIERYQRERVA